MKNIKISIRNLVEFVMMRGDIDNRFVGSIKAIEGIRGHQIVQKSYKENYQAEVSIKHIVEYEDMNIYVEGRIDGILIENEKIIIDEIKTTTKDLLLIDEDTNPLHWAQAKCYGYIYCVQNELDNIDIQITYYNIDSKSTRILRKNYDFEELKESFYYLIKEYKIWAELESKWITKRNESMRKLKFPFDEYRHGQRDLAIRVYKSIKDEVKCFASAPTGTGKTISTLFPSIKAMGEGYTSKIFYLTSKTITREVAQNTISLLREQDISIKAINITAKEKVCKMKEVNCNPEYCTYAKGYYDRLRIYLKDIIKNYDDYNRDNIDKISEEYKLCPFELSLDLTMSSDVIICDYNYVFDPRVYLKRFFDVKKTDYTFLIDEAHNLVDRARDMYSTEISYESIITIKNKLVSKDKRIKLALKESEEFLLEKQSLLDLLDEQNLVEEKIPFEFREMLYSLSKLLDEYLSKNKDEDKELMDLYFDINRFISISDIYDENYVTVYTNDFKGVTVKLYCVNPSKVIIEKMSKSKSTTIFSATLIPMDYFTDMYGYNEDDFKISLISPFDTNNRLLMIGDNISTTYSKRQETSDDIISYIYNVASSKQGNYMVFFPSYKYMELVFEKIEYRYPDLNVSMQDRNMSEEDKDEFLNNFEENPNYTHIAFCVLGGHFSEGIDLINDKLIGVIIVGVGMPQIGIDRDIIKNNMNEKNQGFDYAYVYPGMIKVLQAAGRCIRTDDDKGVILLLDSRYSQNRYKRLFPYDWHNNIRVKNTLEVLNNCNEFWNKHKL